MSSEPEIKPLAALKIIHITDTHLLNRANDSFYGFDTRKSFEKVVQASLTEHPDADFMVLTGDISQNGKEQSYRQLTAVIETIDIPVFAVPGNHDSPQFLQNIFDDCPGQSICVVNRFHYPLVLISSWKRGAHQGEVSAQSLQQLASYLDTCKHSLVIMGIHHPPVQTGSEWLDLLGLENKRELLGLLSNYNLNIIMLCGHIHQELEVYSSNLKVMVTPSTCHQFEPLSKLMAIDDGKSPAYRTIVVKDSELVDSTVHFVNVCPQSRVN